ncbi:MAG: inosine/xanthosine triphosphatase [Methanobacteriota archaeon]
MAGPRRVAWACMGGTFDVLHRGHRALLSTAFAAADRVFIGLTTDALARGGRERDVASYDERETALRRALGELGVARRAEVGPIEDAFGRALEPQFAAIVVTPETRKTAARINRARAGRRLRALAVVVVPHVLAFDGLPVSATRIRAGEIREDGWPLRKVQVAVGSANPVKVEAVDAVLRRQFPEVVVRGVDVSSGVAAQPRGAATTKGAVTRAKRAAAKIRADWGVGIEAGLVPDPSTGGLLDVQVAAIVDRAGRVTLGHGPGFLHPHEVLARVRKGETVGEAIGRLAGVKDIGRSEGAIGFLTRGTLDRTRLTESAVLMALVPRLRPELYGL